MRYLIMILSFAIVVGLCLLAGPSNSSAQNENVDLTGTYYGPTSGLTATIKKHGECYQVFWKDNKDASWIGIGYVMDNTFITAWDHRNGGNLGLGFYRIWKGAKGPKLVGWCVQYQNGTLNERTETDQIEFIHK